jgi:CheY-like chemotaxis protein
MISPCSGILPGVLYVEDDEAIRSVYGEVLLRAGYSVDLAENGEAGWDALQRGEYDLLITDHNMPLLSGLQLAIRVRGAGLSLPIVLASGCATIAEDDAYAWLRLFTLRKPFTPTALLQIVEAILCAVPLAARPSRRIAIPVELPTNEPKTNPQSQHSGALEAVKDGFVIASHRTYDVGPATPDALITLSHMAHGKIRDTAEVGGDLEAAAIDLVREAIEGAKEMGLSAEDAASAAANGALKAAEESGPAAVDAVRKGVTHPSTLC